MPFLRQSTTQIIRFGPCLDKDDRVTEETGLTLAQADMRLSKDGAAFDQKSAAGNATHDSDGWYSTTLSITDTDTVGELRLNIHQPANMLPVEDRWWVLEEAIYDAMYGASADGIAKLAHIGPYGLGVFIDDGAGNTNTVLGTDGIESNPVSTIAAATTIVNALGSQRFYLINDTQITLAQTYECYSFIGIGILNQINLGSQDVDNCHFQDLILTGTQGGVQFLHAHGCQLQNLLSAEIIARDCEIIGDVTMRAAVNQTFINCASAVPGGGTPSLIFPGAGGPTTVNWRHYSGGLRVKDARLNDIMSYEADGQFIIDATCTSLEVHIRGMVNPITDDGTTSIITKIASIEEIEGRLPSVLVGGRIDSDIGAKTGNVALSDQEKLDVNTEADTAFSDYDPPTKAEMDAAHALLATPAQVNAEMDNAWATQMADSIPAVGTIETREQALYIAVRKLLSFGYVSTTHTIYKADGTTPLLTITLDDATNPTLGNRAT